VARIAIPKYDGCLSNLLLVKARYTEKQFTFRLVAAKQSNKRNEIYPLLACMHNQHLLHSLLINQSILTIFFIITTTKTLSHKLTKALQV